MKRLAIILALLGGPVWAQGYWISGNTLFDMCSSDVAWKRTQCTGYVMGVIDGANNATNISNSEITPICTSEEATRDQVADIVTKHLRENPETRHLTAASRVRLAISTAFPCA